MEEPKATSEFVYKDEYCYITEENELIRKAGEKYSRKKVADISTDDDIEETLSSYRAAFKELETQINALDAPIADDTLQEWKDKLVNTDAIGDLDRLFEQLEELQASPDTNGQAEETETVNDEESAAEGEDQKEEPEAEEEQENETPVEYYKQLTKEAQAVSNEENWSEGSKKLDKLSHRWSEGPEAQDEEAEEEIKDLFYKFTKATERFENQKEAYYKEADLKREENLSSKRDVLDKINTIVDNENWSATGPIKKLERKWHGIGQVPKEQAADIQNEYESLIKEFKSHKVDRLVDKRQKREDNLMMKMAVLDKMEKVAADIDDDTENWKEIDTTFDGLTKQWKKIGRAPREKSKQVWTRYKAAQDGYYDQKYRHHTDHRSKVDSFTAKKENIIEDAEALVKQKDIANAARGVNKLHHRWKKIGNLPQRKEDKLWDRFKAATDAFNEKKAKNADTIKEQEEQHYQQKLKLIEEAEELKDTDDWKRGHREMQSMMDKWKQIGPVPRKKSNKIWRQFKGAMDVFYDRRREHFKEAKKNQKENLKKKQELLEKLRDLHQHEDPIAAVDEAKKLQAEFKDVGYVPIKRKDEMWQKYREACDVIYDRMRAAKSGDKFDQELAQAELDTDQRSQIQNLRKEYKRVENEVRSLKDEVLQMQESKSNFNFSDEDNPLFKQMQDKIDKAAAKLESKQNKLDALSMEMDDIREEE
jgi:hypothetical protein